MTSAPRLEAEIVERIAALEGIDPLDLEDRLYDVIDVDALAALTAGDRQSTSRVEFTYYGYTVAVDGTGSVSVDDRGG
jgi:hypothetical protein